MSLILPSRTHDNTMATAFERCPRLYHITYNLNLVHRLRSAALDFGSLVHLGLSIWYSHFNKPGATRDSALLAAIEAMSKADYQDVGEDFRTRERAILTMAEYADYYGWLERTQGWNLKVILTETAFDTVDEQGLPWGGKMDLVVEWRGDLYILDHKTTSRKGDDYFQQFVPDTQTGGYVKYGSLLAGRPIVGVIINNITVHKNKKPPKDQFDRRPFSYPDFYIREWEEQIKDHYRQVAYCEEHNVWRPRWQSCTNKYGKCPAFYICRTAPENRGDELSKNFVERTWDWRSVEGAEDMG